MGITGATGIKGIVGSNVSMAVIKLRIPTLIVPLESVLSLSPTITLATDYKTKLSKTDIKALNEILNAANPKKLHVLHLAEKIIESKIIESGEKKLRTLIPQTEVDFYYINHSKTPNGIIDFIEHHETDILCLVKHNHNIIYRLFASSTINQVLNKTVKAILVLHE